MRFALLEAKLALASIIRKYNLSPSSKTQEPLELDPTTAIAYVKHGLYIKAEQRIWKYVIFIVSIIHTICSKFNKLDKMKWYHNHITILRHLMHNLHCKLVLCTHTVFFSMFLIKRLCCLVKDFSLINITDRQRYR